MDGGFVPGCREQLLCRTYYHLAPACAPPSIRMFSPFTMGADSKYSKASTISETCTNRRAGFSCFKMSWSSLACIGVSTTARRDGVDPNPVRHELHGQGAAKRRNRGLGNDGKRNGRASQWLIRQHRGNADDLAGLLFSHLSDCLLRHEEITGDIGADGS